MQRSFVLASGLIAGAILAGPVRAQDNQDILDRGKYLVTMGDCAACHTAPGGKYTFTTD